MTLRIGQWAIAILGLSLAACGGGGGGNAAADNPPANNPAPQPSVDAQDKARFEAAKLVIEAGGDDTRSSKWNDSIYIVNGAIIRSVRATEDGKSVYRKDFRSLPQGLATLRGENWQGNAVFPVVIRSYQGFHSGVAMAHKAPEFPGSPHTYWAEIYGAYTPRKALPAQGKATYTGIAFDEHEEGNINYHVDFGNKKGSGVIEGLSRYGKITLHEAPWTGVFTLNGSSDFYRVSNAPVSSEKGHTFLGYNLHFAGLQAEEISGYILTNQHVGIGFHGTRGEISR